MTVTERSADAGTYELLATRWERRTSKVGEPFTFTRFHRGDLVDLDAEEATRLLKHGLVCKPGAREAAAAARAKEDAERAQAAADRAKAKAQARAKAAREAKEAKSQEPEEPKDPEKNPEPPKEPEGGKGKKGE